MLQHPRDLIARLVDHPKLVGIVRYGGRSVEAPAPGGDLDLCLIVDERPPPMESIHFYVGSLPVDLNLRTWRDLERDPPLTPIDDAILAGEVLYDRDGDLAQRLRGCANRRVTMVLSAHDLALIRFGQRHSLDKVVGRLATDPLLCRMLLESNVYWAIRHYFTVRDLSFPGDRAALVYLAQHESATYKDIEAFYRETGLPARLALATGISEQILAPVGGLWRRDEVLSFGTGMTADDLQAVGRQWLQDFLNAIPGSSLA
ncbi:MAG: hypothetical protein AB7R89_01955 [Dehalococcoidia bacterium]